jgi:hypothetical protein
MLRFAYVLEEWIRRGKRKRAGMNEGKLFNSFCLKGDKKRAADGEDERKIDKLLRRGQWQIAFINLITHICFLTLFLFGWGNRDAWNGVAWKSFYLTFFIF